MKRNQIIIPGAAIILLMTGGCRKTTTKDLSAEAATLFARSVTLIESYTDSLEAANDSARINRLLKTFDSKYTALNFEFPPDTDMSMTEEHNDSLIMLLDKMVTIRKERFKTLAQASNDTISPEDITLSEPPSHNQHN